MANESKKAGIPAFQFDPDASPAAKAAQAQAVRSPRFSSGREEVAALTTAEKQIPGNFHRNKAPKAVGIATDIVTY